jgi:uncharacterized protein YlxW (UPF0749 family)
LAERAKGRAGLLKDTTAKEQRIIDLERELKEVREAAATNKKKLEDELAEEKLRTMCGSRTGGWSLPCVMSD